MINTLCAQPIGIQATAPLHRLRFSSNRFAFDPVTGLTYTFSDSAACLIDWMRDGLDGRQIEARMQRKFGVSEHRAAIDLARLRMDLKQLELLH